MADPDLQNQSLKAVSKSTRSKPGWARRLAWSFAAVIVLLIVFVGVGVLWLRSAAMAALPQLDGDIHLTRVLSAPVTVRRDAHGVPRIDAANLTDLLIAQGYVTAQDRLWQMDTLRRSVDGELAEVMGRALVPHDRLQRVLQFRRTAQRLYANLDPEDRADLDAYARGVNLFIAQHEDSLPPEFRLLHYRPQPWTGADSLAIGVALMSETLDNHWDVKLTREEIAVRLKDPKLESDLYPVGSWRDHPPTGEVIDLSQPHAAPPSSDRSESGQTGAEVTSGDDLRALRALLHPAACESCAPGSNEWVIAGQHTASGKPLLSNDMHLSLTVPDIWYMAGLRAPGLHAAGVTIPGVPFITAGHDDHVAWGYTALYADVQDLYIERLDGGGHYRAADGSWQPLIVDHEVIHVRGGKDVPVDVQLTAHGPLLNPLLKHENRPISLKWTLYDTSGSSVPIYKLNTASSCSEVTAALSTWTSPTLNVVCADDQGHIAYHAVGRIPLRPAGLVGVPIRDQAHEWQGYIPFDALPNSTDPPSGFLATANSRVTASKTPYPLTLEWAEPYRAERIYKLLQGRDHLTPADMLAVQTDLYSEVDQELAQRFAYAIDHVSNADARLRAAADLMRNWDGRLTTDSAAASIVTQAKLALGHMILEAKLGDLASDYSWSESNFAEEQIVMDASPAWLPRGYKNWNDLLAEAVRRGMHNGHAPANLNQWTYGSWHVIDLEHPLVPFLPMIGRIAGTGPQPLSGDTVTVKQVGRTFGPSQRFTMDWSNIDGSTENIVLGESGNPLSPYFRDQWKDYYNGTTFALPFTSAAVAAQTQHTLHFLP